MAASFVAASTKYLSSVQIPLTAAPFTVGLWIKLTAVGAVARSLWTYSDTATTNNYWMIRMTSTELVTIVARAGSTENASSIALAITAGGWYFVIGRFIASANRRIHYWDPAAGSVVQSNQTTTTRAVTSPDMMTLGALQTSGGVTEPWDGEIAEYWLMNGNVQPDDTVIDTALMLQLGKYGPLSVPHVRNRLIEYLPLKNSLLGDKDDYYSSRGRRTWTNTNGVTLA